jgi:hypothetical protein
MLRYRFRHSAADGKLFGQQKRIILPSYVAAADFGYIWEHMLS